MKSDIQSFEGKCIVGEAIVKLAVCETDDLKFVLGIYMYVI